MTDRSEWTARPSGCARLDADARTDGTVDYARIVHSSSFRRLQGKTQILSPGGSGSHRTRLTHSIEVAQIASGLARQVERNDAGHPGVAHLPPTDTIQAIGLAHDLGHPPFGHGGEGALDACMRGHGGFEGNGQTLRILSRLERYSREYGADLTRRTLLGTLKYPVAYSSAVDRDGPATPRADAETPASVERHPPSPPKCYMDGEQAIVDWILAPLRPEDRDLFVETERTAGGHARAKHKSLDCSLMDLGDDIAYGVHDLEDAIALKLVDEADFRRLVPAEKFGPHLSDLRASRPGDTDADAYDRMVGRLFGDGYDRKHAVGRLVGHLVRNCFIETRGEFEEPLLRYRARMVPGSRLLLDGLQDLVTETVIRGPLVQQLEFKGRRMVTAVFEALLSDPRSLLPLDVRKEIGIAGSAARIVCDHVAGMTDGQLERTYERLFSPRMGVVVEGI